MILETSVDRSFVFGKAHEHLASWWRLSGRASQPGLDEALVNAGGHLLIALGVGVNLVGAEFRSAQDFGKYLAPQRSVFLSGQAALARA